MHADADRQFRLDLAHARLQGLAEAEEVAGGLHRDGEADRGLAVEAEHRLGRVDGAAADVGDVAQPEEAVVDAEVDGPEAVLRAELAADAQAHALGPRLNDAGGRDGVLRLQGLDQGLRIDSEPGHLADGEVEPDLLVLGAEELHLADARHPQDVGAHALDVVAQLAEGQAVRREGVDVAEDVSELVVEEGSLDARREVACDVADVLAHLIEDLADGALVDGVLELHEDGGLARRRVALGVVERIDLLELLLDAVGDLVHRFLNRGAGPRSRNDHGLDGEGRILLPPQAAIGQDAGEQRHEHQEPHEGAMFERPFGQVEAGLLRQVLGGDPGRHGVPFKADRDQAEPRDRVRMFVRTWI